MICRHRKFDRLYISQTSLSADSRSLAHCKHCKSIHLRIVQASNSLSYNFIALLFLFSRVLNYFKTYDLPIDHLLSDSANTLTIRLDEMRKSVVVLIAVCIAFVLFGQNKAQAEVFIRFERNNNFITLTCQNGADLTNVPNAQFFRNNLRIDNQPGFSNDREDGVLRFQMDREREGNYACGKNQSVQSNFESIIGKFSSI